MKRTTGLVMTVVAFGAGWALGPFFAMGCGLDWTLPQAHFNGVEEHGYVAYWEKIGDVALSDKLTIPVNIGFNSRRETSSPALGKGWIVALLESHVEPIDENSVNVVMPDGWTFLFLRNGNSETWRGNDGWAGESNDSVFTIAAPCGWKIRFDGGKIQEIDGSAIAPLTYLYDGGVATEIDQAGRALVRLDRDPVSGTATGLVVGGEAIHITLAQRPRVATMLKQNLITGFDASVASLQLPDGRNELFTFGTDKDLTPNVAISGTDLNQRLFAWDPDTRQIKRDGEWSYAFQQVRGHLRIDRTTAEGKSEAYEADDVTGMTAEKAAEGTEIRTYRFASGPLAGSIRKIEQVTAKGAETPLYSASYFPSGQIMREIFYPDKIRTYSEQRQLLKETIGGHVDYEQDLDDQGRVVHTIDTTKNLEVTKSYDANGGQTTQVFRNAQLLYTEKIDSNNKLVSLNEGNK